MFLIYKINCFLPFSEYHKVLEISVAKGEPHIVYYVSKSDSFEAFIRRDGSAPKLTMEDAKDLEEQVENTN